MNFYNWNVQPFYWHKMNGLYVIDSDFIVSLDDKKNKYTFKFYEGLMTDGGSIPKIFSWIDKGWTGDYVHDACYILHDFCYGSECVIRSIADDMLRSSLRDYGLSRFKASTICWAVNNFAESHYGFINDNLDIASYGKLLSIDTLK